MSVASLMFASAGLVINLEGHAGFMEVVIC